jgi:hypothetical protein
MVDASPIKQERSDKRSAAAQVRTGLLSHRTIAVTIVNGLLWMSGDEILISMNVKQEAHERCDVSPKPPEFLRRVELGVRPKLGCESFEIIHHRMMPEGRPAP